MTVETHFTQKALQTIDISEKLKYLQKKSRKPRENYGKGAKCIKIDSDDKALFSAKQLSILNVAIRGQHLQNTRQPKCSAGSNIVGSLFLSPDDIS